MTSWKLSERSQRREQQRCSQTWCPQWRSFKQRPCCSEGRSAALMRSAAAVCSSSGPEDSSRCRNWLGRETPESCDGSRGRRYEFRLTRQNVCVLSDLGVLCPRLIHTNSGNQTERRMKTPYLLFLFCEALLHKYSLLPLYHCYCETEVCTPQFKLRDGSFWRICVPLTAVINYY